MMLLNPLINAQDTEKLAKYLSISSSAHKNDYRLPYALRERYR
jgi:hypothetical protein